MPIDIRLVRPVQQTGGPLVRVQLDGVLFDDLSFYGPNKLNSQRAMTFWEVEAQRDRAYFKQALQATRRERPAAGNAAEHGEAGGPSAAGCFAHPQRPRGRLRGSRDGSRGAVRISESAERAGAACGRLGGDFRATKRGLPQIEVVNRSSKPVRYVEIGWLVKDRSGHEYMAGSVPASETSDAAACRAATRLLQDTALKFSRTGTAGGD